MVTTFTLSSNGSLTDGQLASLLSGTAATTFQVGVDAPNQSVAVGPGSLAADPGLTTIQFLNGASGPQTTSQNGLVFDVTAASQPLSLQGNGTHNSFIVTPTELAAETINGGAPGGAAAGANGENAIQVAAAGGAVTLSDGLFAKATISNINELQLLNAGNGSSIVLGPQAAAEGIDHVDFQGAAGGGVAANGYLVDARQMTTGLTIHGSSGGNDTLLGSSGDDQFLVGQTGSATINGGGGNDTAVFSNPLSSYTVSTVGTIVTVSLNGGSTVDSIAGVAQLQFSDQTVATAPLLQNATGLAIGFDANYYLAHNPDVAQSGMDPLLHYQTFGWQEGRAPDSLFDVGYYLANNPDVAAAGIDPLAHYEQFGWKEGRNPSAAFNTNGYLAANSDVQLAGMNPLDHYLMYGMAEGRAA